MQCKENIPIAEHTEPNDAKHQSSKAALSSAVVSSRARLVPDAPEKGRQASGLLKWLASSSRKTGDAGIALHKFPYNWKTRKHFSCFHGQDANTIVFTV